MDDSHKIHYRHHSHRQIHNAPCLLQRYQCSSHHCCSRDDAEEVDIRHLAGDKPNVGLAIELVGDDGAVGKEEDGSRYEHTAKRPDVVFKRIFGEYDAVATAVINAREQDDEGSA